MPNAQLRSSAVPGPPPPPAAISRVPPPGAGPAHGAQRAPPVPPRRLLHAGPAASRRHVNEGRGGGGGRRAGPCRAEPSRALQDTAWYGLPPARRSGYPPRGEEHDEVRSGGDAVLQHLGAVKVPPVRLRLLLRLGSPRHAAEDGAESGPGQKAPPGRAGAQRSHSSGEQRKPGQLPPPPSSLPLSLLPCPPLASPRLSLPPSGSPGTPTLGLGTHVSLLLHLLARATANK